MLPLFDPARAAIRQRISDVFNDAEKGERPVLRRADALFAPDSVAWKVNRIHASRGGTLPDGSPYRVTDPALLAWVHVTETISFLDAWIRYAEPTMPMAEQDAYFDEMAVIGTALNADPVPRTRAEAEALIQSYRPQLRADTRTHEVAALVMRQTVGSPAIDRAAALIMQAGMDLMPDWARAMHRQPGTLPAPLVRAGAMSTARFIRWAFQRSPNRTVWPDHIERYP